MHRQVRSEILKIQVNQCVRLQIKLQTSYIAMLKVVLTLQKVSSNVSPALFINGVGEALVDYSHWSYFLHSYKYKSR